MGRARRRTPRRWSFVVAASTLPVRRVRVEGKATWISSPGGLVSALRPIVQRREGAWVGWSGQTGVPPRPFSHEGVRNIPIGLSKDEDGGFYQGVCNRTLWPLYHDAVREPEYHRHWWETYVAVNRRFAARIADSVIPRGTVWVQDYHLHLVPLMLRRSRPDLRIGFFLHIPFPPESLFARVPWRQELLKGLLGADVIGFQTKRDAQNFRGVVPRFTSAERSGRSIVFDGHVAHVEAHPISIDMERFEEVARRPDVVTRAEAIRQSLGRGRRVILGVDRLDYTKGIDLRLKAFTEYLARRKGPLDTVLVQIAIPSRERIAEYEELRSRVEELVGQVNGRFGEVGISAVHYLRRTLPFEELIAEYRAADVMFVTPLADGMNLVAKEYVASRVDERGVLVLSEFTGAAEELGDAILVNPHDVDGMAEGISRALGMPPDEQRRRMRAMRRVVRRHTVHDWATGFMDRLSVAVGRVPGV